MEKLLNVFNGFVDNFESNNINYSSAQDLRNDINEFSDRELSKDDISLIENAFNIYRETNSYKLAERVFFE